MGSDSGGSSAGVLPDLIRVDRDPRAERPVRGQPVTHVGRAAGLATVAGNAAGEYLLVVAVAVGIGAIVSSSIAIFTAVKLAGAAYLVYLGVPAIRHRRG